MKYHALLLFLALYAALICAEGQSAPINDSMSGQSQIINSSDSGFRPDINGFSFENYGSNIPALGLTPKDMQRMFGDKVIASKAGGKIILTPPANRWMIEANNAMGNGHCEGMAVLSELIYYNKVNPISLGGMDAADLSLDNQNLQREIAYWWTTQVTSPGGSQRIDESPNAVLDTLKKAFKDGRKATEWWVLGLFMPDGTEGHTISPIAVKDFGNGTADIFVYDNNFPDMIRSVKIDTKNNSWMYYASVNPNEPSAMYTGNASTHNLEVVSISSRLDKQRCDFCDNSLGGTETSTGEEYIHVWQEGNANLVIADESGRRIGYPEPNKFVNEIPNAEVKYFKFAAKKKAPLYILPATGNFTIEINGIGLTEESFVNVMMIGPGSEMGVQRIVLGPNERDHMNVTKVGRQYQLNYKSNRSKNIDLIVGVTTVEGGYEFLVAGAKVDPEGKVSINIDTDKSNFVFDTNGNSNPGPLQLTMTRIDSSGEQTFTGNTALSPNNAVVMNYAGWQGDGNSMPIQVINNDAGTTTTSNMIDTQNTQGSGQQDIGYSPSSSLGSVSLQSGTSDSNSAGNQNPPTNTQSTGTQGPLVGGENPMGQPFNPPSITGQNPININI
ncbi:MAG: hypothetical protein ACE14P_14250 [Methanotrichaceae archaeon]